MSSPLRFNYPEASGDKKYVNNTFLWDYYYSKNGTDNNAGPDANTDIYQQYYENSREYSAYPLLAPAEPYIIGFPSKTYYEFDLSGEFVARNTATPAPDQLTKQIISFVSEPAITIGISDVELKAASVVDGYTFLPNYMTKTVDGYLMNSEGNSFDVTPTGGSPTVPFRPYFIAGAPTQAAPAKNAARSIIFTSNETAFSFEYDNDPTEGQIGDGSLLISALRHKITVTSSLLREADVRIVNTSGITVANFTIQPGETIDTNIGAAGVYVVRADGGRIQKKFAIK